MAGAIARAGGPEVQRESDERAPIGLGDAVETTAGDMPARWVIHAATMELGGPTSAEIIERATRSTLDCGRAARMLARSRSWPSAPAWAASRSRRPRGSWSASRASTEGGLERIVFAVHGDDAERAFAAEL